MNGIFLNSAIILSGDPNVASPWLTSLDIVYKVIISIVGIAGISIFFLKGKFKTLQAIKTMASTVNAFMEKILPDLLQGFEKKGFVPSGALSSWAKVVSAEKYSIKSPKRLNKEGQLVLKESGMKEIIDTHMKTFIKELKDENLESPLDLENRSFEILKSKEKDKITIPLRYYLYDHSDEDIDTIFFVGSIYLRDKYIERHPEMLLLDDQKRRSSK